MKIKLNFSDGTYLYSSSITKRKLGPSSTILKSKEDGFEGHAKVTYSHGGWNAFDFTSKEDFLEKVMPAMDKELDEQY